MKNIISLFCLLLVTSISIGQNKKTEKADKLYNSYQYVDAIEEYLKLTTDNEVSAYVSVQLADSYYNIYNIEEASKWYKTALEKQPSAETYYKYAQVLKSQGKYKLANEQMDVFAKLMPEDERAKAYLKNPNYIPQLVEKDKLFNVEETTINDDKQSDFGAVLSNDNILYFVSTRKSSKKQDSWTKQSYLDIYKSIRNEDGTLSTPEEVAELNTQYHDGPLTISKDGKTMYFSRDGHSMGTYKKIKNNKVKLAQQGIYKATLIDGKWDNITALPINSNDYTVSHPSLSPNGSTYGNPVNMGENVNTSGKEGFPFIAEDDILYFASSGRQGFGGFDIFKCDLKNDTKAENLGNAINTKSDDFSFSVNAKNKIGYFSSNRSGADNIYLAIPICQFETYVIVKDKVTNTVLKNAEITISDSQNREIATQKSDKNGKTDFNVSCEDSYSISVSKKGYNEIIIPVTPSEGNDVTINVDLEPINEIITEREVKLNNIYFEFNKSNITQQGALELDKLVRIMKDYPDMNILVRSHTDTKGSADYNKKLSERRAKSTVQYLISKGVDKSRLSSEGVGSKEPLVKCTPNCTDSEDAQNRRSEFLIKKN